MMRKINKTSFFFTSMIYVCGLFLFLEWIYPMKTYDETSSLSVFIVYTLFCFLISLLNVKWWASFLLKGFSLLFIMNALFFEDPFLSKVWFKKLYVEILVNANLLLDQHWYELTSLLRSLLFLLLIWLMSYLIHYWFFTMKRIFLFSVLTFIYISVLDTFTIYDGSLPIIRIFIVSFIALGMTNFLKEVTRESIQLSLLKKPLVWFTPIVVIVLLTSLIGYAAPKYSPQWPDPVPFIKSFADHSKFTDDVRKVGYGTDDSKLGGSFNLDDTPVFNVTAKRRHYWRIETKDVYTGKGWQSSQASDDEFLSNGIVSYQTFSGNVEVENLEALVEYQGNVLISKLAYPYGLRHIESNDQTDFYMDHYSGAIEKYLNENFTKEIFKMNYLHPLYDLNVLRKSDGNDPQMIVEQYTKVPSTLPERVHDLAKEITASSHNRYDQAKAIEQYFSSSGFQYRTSGIPYPAEDQDYVDQFLFDTQVGYCDNYSTSMVVLLRTLNIPARWVKGFTGGQKIDHPSEDLDEDYDYYEITNANAHSWVEVHFPDIGWVPFEPTQGFTNPTEFYDSIEEQEDHEEIDQTIEDEDFELDESEPTVPEDLENSEAEDENMPAENSKPHIHWGYKVVGLMIILCIGIIIFQKRIRWQTLYVAKQFQSNPDFSTFDKAYHHLLRMLNLEGFIKKPEQTLREYAKYIDEHYETNEMSILTHDYEKMLYNNEMNQENLKEQVELWQSLVKRINS